VRCVHSQYILHDEVTDVQLSRGETENIKITAVVDFINKTGVGKSDQMLVYYLFHSKVSEMVEKTIFSFFLTWLL
jgi:hypothetical protein